MIQFHHKYTWEYFFKERTYMRADGPCSLGKEGDAYVAYLYFYETPSPSGSRMAYSKKELISLQEEIPFLKDII